MTYKLDAILQKIASPVTLILPDGNQLAFENGPAAFRTSFNHRYIVNEINAVGDVVTVTLREQSTPAMNWVGEEAIDAETVSFF